MISVKERQHFLDVLRVAATCAVVLLHTVTGVMDNTNMSLYPMEHKVFLTVRDLVCWCVPVFIMISGYLFLHPGRELTFDQVVTKYCRRILLALFLFGAPYAWIELAVMEGHLWWGMLWEGVARVLRWESWSHMWYLYLILSLYLLTPAIRWVLKKLPDSVVYILLIVLFAGGSVLPFAENMLGTQQLWALPGDSIYLFYYLCGYLFACREKWEKWLFILFAGLAVILAAGMAYSRLAGYSVQMAYNYPFTVLLALCLFGAALALEKNPLAKMRTGAKKNTALWERAAKLCFAVYLIHPVFLNIFYKFFDVTPLSFSIGASLPLFFLGTMAFSAAAAWVLRKIPALRKYVL